ncbi:hypothetical protein BH10PSE13_BH10PSE13_09180 [soil metagenome]
MLLALMMAHHGLSIALNGASLAFAATGALLLLARHAFGANGRFPRPVLSVCAEDVLLFTTIALIGAVSSYAVAAYSAGWVDVAMLRFDAAIGYDWRTSYALTAVHPFLQVAGRAVYASIYVSPAILILSFARSGQRAEARLFLAAFWLAATLSLFFFLFMPTLGPLSYLWRGPVPYMPTSGLYQADLIPLLREHRLHVIDLGRLRGLVGPPSFHAASAMLYMIAAWRTRNLRVPLTVLNIAMLFSIPVEGTHYAIDVISGAAVAVFANAVVVIFARRWATAAAVPPVPMLASAEGL